MKRVYEILKRAQMEKIFFYLLSGDPKVRKRLTDRYVKLYCLVTDNVFGKDKTVIYDFKTNQDVETKKNDGETEYVFTGVTSWINDKKITDSPIEWKKTLQEGKELVISDEVWTCETDEKIMAVLLYQLEKKCASIPWSDRGEDSAVNELKRQILGKIESIKFDETNDMPKIQQSMEEILRQEWKEQRLMKEMAEYEPFSDEDVWYQEILRMNANASMVGERTKTRAGKAFFKRFLLEMEKCPEDLSIYWWFVRLDPDNTPDPGRCFEVLNTMKQYDEAADSRKKSNAISDNNGMIVIENTSYLQRLPIVYVQEQNGRQRDVDKCKIKELMCMDICVQNPEYEDKAKTLALLIFYLTYPVRVRRIQKGCLSLELLHCRKETLK